MRSWGSNSQSRVPVVINETQIHRDRYIDEEGEDQPEGNQSKESFSKLGILQSQLGNLLGVYARATSIRITRLQDCRGAKGLENWTKKTTLGIMSKSWTADSYLKPS
ncbi:hypothetical protein KQX54_008882 [Cotesia glomerata]|uniref:Uncharacterized protein n=1 Tax=Cotesia glomerata TaxID=32391 RepID=A0AAV7J232_COTGL|nr:hypothetical protein KQX54_008882 [Cotesia glomerata]